MDDGIEHLKIYDVISNLTNKEQRRKLEMLLGSVVQSIQTNKEIWFKSTDSRSKEISSEKMKINENTKLPMQKKKEKLSSLMDEEAFLTMESLAKARVEFEYLVNLIISLTLDSAPKIMERIMRGDYDNSKIKSYKFLKEGKIEEILLELYSEEHIDFHNIKGKDKLLLLTIYEYELEFILDFIKFIKEFLEFLRKVRNNMYHNFFYANLFKGWPTMYPDKWIKESTPVFVFNQRLSKGYFDSFYSGPTVITYNTRIMNICIMLEKIPIWQYIRLMERNQRLIDVLVSPKGTKLKNEYFKILAKYGFPRGKPGMEIMIEELEHSKKGDNMMTQRKLNQKFEAFLEKYPP